MASRSPRARAVLAGRLLPLLLAGCATLAEPPGPEPPGPAPRRPVMLPPAGDGEERTRTAPPASACADVRGGPHGRPLDLRMNFDVVDRLLEFVDRGEASDEDLNLWVRLPGNRELLRLGWPGRTLTPEILKEAVRVTVRGSVFPGAGPLGRIDVGSWLPLRQIVSSIRAREAELVLSLSRTTCGYLPPDRTLPPLRILFHVGGTWDGRTSDAVYINLTFFQSRGLDSLPALDALLLHEAFHLAQAALLPGVEDYTSPQSTLFTALLRTEQEGIAREIEYRRLAEEAPGTALDRSNFQKYTDGLRHAAEAAALLEGIREAAEGRKIGDARTLIDQGFASGGPLYAVGQAMARTIEEGSGREALVATVVEGPIAFFEAYWEAARLSGRPSILPAALGPAVAELKRGFGGAWTEATHLRLRGRRLMEEGKPEEAIEALRRVVRIDPSDGVTAYNLACSYALAGSKGKALSWLKKSVERGFDRFKHIATDPDLESLHDEPEFGDLLRRHGIGLPPAVR